MLITEVSKHLYANRVRVVRAYKGEQKTTEEKKTQSLGKGLKMVMRGHIALFEARRSNANYK